MRKGWCPLARAEAFCHKISMRKWVRVLLALVAVAPVTAANGVSDSRGEFASGCYHGTGTGHRLVPVPFQPAIVLIKRTDTRTMVWKSDRFTTDTQSPSERVGPVPDAILTFTPSGFLVGTSDFVNSAHDEFCWYAWRTGTHIKTGSYLGDGTALRDITGLGFAPDIVIVQRDQVRRARIRLTSTAPLDRNAPPWSDLAAAGGHRIVALLPDGFRVSDDGDTNEAGGTYYWLAFKAEANFLTTGAYTGDGLATQTIAVPDCDVRYLYVWGDIVDNTTDKGRERSRAQPRDWTQSLLSEPDTTGSITALDNRSFTAGPLSNVAGRNYYYWAMCTQTTVCPGDCGDTRHVTIADVINGVNIALGRAPLTTCRTFDADGDATVSVDELIAAVNSTLHGCQ